MRSHYYSKHAAGGGSLKKTFWLSEVNLQIKRPMPPWKEQDNSGFR